MLNEAERRQVQRNRVALHGHASSCEERERKHRPRSPLQGLRVRQAEAMATLGDKHRREGLELRERHNAANRAYELRGADIPQRHIRAQNSEMERLQRRHADERAELTARHLAERDAVASSSAA